MPDVDDFERFAESHAPALTALAYRLTGQREAARDLVQEVLLAVFRQWPKVSAATHRSAYVRRMLVHQHLNSLRRRVVEIPRADVHEMDTRAEESSAYGDGVAERDAMWRALSGLSDRQRAVLVLRFYEGLDYSAIATVIGCREATVRSLAARGLRVAAR